MAGDDTDQQGSLLFRAGIQRQNRMAYNQVAKPLCLAVAYAFQA